MSKRFSNEKNDSPAKRFKSSTTSSKDRRSLQNAAPTEPQNNINDLWGDDFREDEIEEMDFIASQATQEEPQFVSPHPVSKVSKPSSSMDSAPSTSSGSKGSLSQNKNNRVYLPPQSQIMGSSERDRREIMESTQAIIFDDFENQAKTSDLHNSTFRTRKEDPSKNLVLVSDDEQLLKLKEENKKLQDDFMTKEGETEFLRQQLNQIQTRAENEKKKQAQLMEEQMSKMRAEISRVLKEKNSLETQLQLQNLQLNSANEKNKLRESGSVKFTSPQLNQTKNIRDRSNTSMNWSPKRIKTKESGIQVSQTSSPELLKTTLVVYPLKIIPKSTFEPAEPEKSVIDIKIEEKIGKRNLAILQEEETFRIFENPELSKPKVTMVYNKILSTEFFLPDLAKLMNKTCEEINSSDSIPILNKLVATTRELLLNSTLVLQKISQALQNDDVRDMNELYLSEFYDMPVLHTRCFCEAKAWYDLERGIETRRALGVLAYVAEVSEYLAGYVAGNHKLKTHGDAEYQEYVGQMNSYGAWDKKDLDFEFLDLLLDFVTIVGSIRRSHQFSGVINSIMNLVVNVQNNVGLLPTGIKRVYEICKEIIYSRPLLTCFVKLSEVLKEFSSYSNFVSGFCTSPDRSDVRDWKGTLCFTPGVCALDVFITQLEHFKLDPISLINITKDIARFSNLALLSNSIPWLEITVNSCNCCLKVLKFVVLNLCECSKVNVNFVKNKYTNELDLKILKDNIDIINKKLFSKYKIFEDWKSYEKEYNGNFWNTLIASQYSAISYGIRLLSYLAKRDLDFMIRESYIQDAFHLFLHNLDNRTDIKLKNSDSIALEIVKQTFVLERNIESKLDHHVLDIVRLENERWTDFNPVNADMIKYYENDL